MGQKSAGWWHVSNILYFHPNSSGVSCSDLTAAHNFSTGWQKAHQVYSGSPPSPLPAWVFPFVNPLKSSFLQRCLELHPGVRDHVSNLRDSELRVSAEGEGGKVNTLAFLGPRLAHEK